MDMPATFHLQLLTPDKTLVDAPASAVIVPGVEGDFTVLPLHMKLVTALRGGEIEVHRPAHDPLVIKVTGGFADVAQDRCVILAEM